MTMMFAGYAQTLRSMRVGTVRQGVPTPPRRRGTALIWTSVTLVCFMGFCSLAVDWGRVVIVKAELQHAADSAARQAAISLKNGFAASREAARVAAAENRGDGSAVVLDVNADVEFGTWDRTAKTFTPLGAAAPASSANAVRVFARRTTARGSAVPLMFARALGISQQDVTASAIATPGAPGFGLIGLDGVTIAGNGSTDSFDSSFGLYNAATARRNGSVASNGNISVAGNGTVKGNAYPGVGKTATYNTRTQITGAIQPLTSPLSFPAPTLPASYTSLGALNLSNGTYYAAAGTYYCTSINISGQAVFYCQGPVKVYCSGPLVVSGGSIATFQNRPANLQIYMTNASPVSLSGQANLHAQIYAPLSPFEQSGKADIYGSIVAKRLDFSGSWEGGVHFDESAGLAGSSGATLVK